MSLLRLAGPKPIAFLIFFSVLAVAQISAPDCTDTSYAWTSNSVGQTPCTAIAYMMGTCNGGQFSVTILNLRYDHYKSRDNPDLCECSTVGYSLFAACSACQGGTWISWSQWRANCTSTQPPGSFPNPVPSGIRVPQWAHIDITKENVWNPNKSYSVGNNPELVPGVTIGPASASTASSSITTSPIISSTTPILVGHRSNYGAIAGGVVGGIAVIAIAVAAVFLCLRRRPRAPSEDGGAVAPPPPPPPPGPHLPMRFYDPNDPTTFPGYRGPNGYHGYPMPA